MIRTVLIDDERANIELLKNLCRTYCPDVEIIGTAMNVDDGIQLIIQEKPDLIFLDIEIHNQTGFDILKVVPRYDYHVIMVTAYEKYAIQAIKIDAIDYLLKPVQLEELISAVQKVKKEMDLSHGTLKPTVESIEFLSVHYMDHIDLIRFDTILFLEAQNTSTRICVKPNHSLISSRTLKEHESMLPPHQFMRVHNSYVVNIREVKKFIRSKTGSLVMSNNHEVPISASRKKDFLDRLNL